MSIIDDTGRDAVERRLRHAVIQHFLDAERRDHLLDAGHRHRQFAVVTAIGCEAERAGGDPLLRATAMPFGPADD